MNKSILDSEVLAEIIDGSPISSFVINKQHQVIHWNRAAETLSGIHRKEMIGKDEQWRAFYTEKRPVMADLIVDGAPEDEIKGYYQGKSKKSDLIHGAYEAEDFFPDLGENGKWLHFTASPLRDDNEEIMGAIETLEDITERRVAQEALYESEKQFKTLFESANDAIWVHDLDGNIIAANNAGAKLIGYSVEEMLGMNVKSFLSDESLRLAKEVRDKLIKHQPLNLPYEQKLLRKNGSEAICMLTTNLITSDDKPTGFQNIARDVTQEKQMQENLHYFLQQITKAQEEERKRIARELHDDTAQVFNSLSRQLDYFLRKKHGLASGEVLFLKDLQAQLNRGVQGVQRYIQDLRPSLLDDLGLIPALRSLAKNIQDTDAIDIHLDVIGEERRFPAEVEVLLFRIAQEALSNVRKHAQASEIRVIIEFAGNKVKMTVSDNGQGFKLSERIDDLPRRGKLGLVGMQERVRLLDGTIDVKSTLGKGTTIVIEVPK
jgi:two-component system sensor histidine kinase DegS